MSKSKRKILVIKLDRVFSRFIRKRDKHCVICGSVNELQNGHFITRGAISTRWDEENCNCQCKECNDRHEINEQPYKKWIEERYGKGKVQELTYKSNQIKKYTIAELEEMIKRYQAELERI